LIDQEEVKKLNYNYEITPEKGEEMYLKVQQNIELNKEIIDLFDYKIELDKSLNKIVLKIK
jgi:hypothetical protein